MKKTLAGLIVLTLAMTASSFALADGNKKKKNAEAIEAIQDQLEIERKLKLYADSLDWPRGSDWDDYGDFASFDSYDPSTWPVSWQEGTDQFFSLFTDDAVVDYPSFGLKFEGKSNDSPFITGVGGIGYMFNAWNMASQTESQTILSNIIVTIDGDEAISKDRFSHVGYLTSEFPVKWDAASFNLGFHEGKWRKEDGEWRLYYWKGTAQINSGD